MVLVINEDIQSINNNNNNNVNNNTMYQFFVKEEIKYDFMIVVDYSAYNFSLIVDYKMFLYYYDYYYYNYNMQLLRNDYEM